MTGSRLVRISYGDKVIVGKAANDASSKVKHRIEEEVRYDKALVTEMHLIQYFILKRMEAPKLALVIIVEENSQIEWIVVRANALLSSVNVDESVADIWIMGATDPLLPAVRRAGCQLNICE